MVQPRKPAVRLVKAPVPDYVLRVELKVKALTERLLEQALAELDAPIQGELPLTQEHHLIRDGDDYADLFTLGARHSADMPSTTGDLL